MQPLCCKACGVTYTPRTKNQTSCSKPTCRNKLWRQRIRQMLADIKTASGCTKCGYKGHHAALDFNHLDPSTKSFNVANAQSLGKGKQQILDEVAKCEILCANCHRIYTYEHSLQPT